MGLAYTEAFSGPLAAQKIYNGTIVQYRNYLICHTWV